MSAPLALEKVRDSFIEVFNGALRDEDAPLVPDFWGTQIYIDEGCGFFHHLLTFMYYSVLLKKPDPQFFEKTAAKVYQAFLHYRQEANDLSDEFIVRVRRKQLDTKEDEKLFKIARELMYFAAFLEEPHLSKVEAKCRRVFGTDTQVAQDLKATLQKVDFVYRIHKFVVETGQPILWSDFQETLTKPENTKLDKWFLKIQTSPFSVIQSEAKNEAYALKLHSLIAETLPAIFMTLEKIKRAKFDYVNWIEVLFQWQGMPREVYLLALAQATPIPTKPEDFNFILHHLAYQDVIPEIFDPKHYRIVKRAVTEVVIPTWHTYDAQKLVTLLYPYCGDNLPLLKQILNGVRDMDKINIEQAFLNEKKRLSC